MFLAKHLLFIAKLKIVIGITFGFFLELSDFNIPKVPLLRRIHSFGKSSLFIYKLFTILIVSL